MKIRKPARDLPQLRRHLKLTSHEQTQRRKVVKLLGCVIALSSSKHCNLNQAFLDRLKRLLILKYLHLMIEAPDAALDIPSPSMKRTVDSFSDVECCLFFRFQKQHLHRLLNLLKFPGRVVFSNGAVLPGEEVFLRGLYELVSGLDKLRIAKHVFGQHPTLQCRAFKWFINHLYDNFGHIVTNNLDWWQRNGFMEASITAIKNRMAMVLRERYQVPETDIEEILNLQRVGLFIDCNCWPTSVVDGGPAEKGANAARWADDIQRSFYNMWKSQHGLKHQTVDNAFGFTVDIAEIEAFKQWNKAMKSVRISIEWNYGYTATLFKYLQLKSKLRLLAGETVSKIYTVATLLRNCVVAYYGCQTSNYFNVNVDEYFLDKYLTQTDY